MIKVLLVDDHEMVRIGVSAYLSVQEDIEVIGEAGDGKQGIDLALSLRPDIILMDLVMEGMNGIDATRAILEEWPEAKILIVTSFLDDEKVYPALEAGAAGYMLKTSKASDIADAVRSVYKGRKVLEPEVTDKMMKKLHHGSKRPLHEELTNREMEILTLMAEGKTNKEIADELFITIKTVKTHVSNILGKLEVQDRTQAVIYAFKNGAVPVTPRNPSKKCRIGWRCLPLPENPRIPPKQCRIGILIRRLIVHMCLMVKYVIKMARGTLYKQRPQVLATPAVLYNSGVKSPIVN